MSGLIGWPRTLVHEGLSGGGAPLVVNGALDVAVADKLARFSFWCAQPAYLWSTQRFALEAVRERNPQIQLLCHFVLHSIWGVPSTEQGNYQGRFAEICARPNGVVPGTKTPNICDTARRAEMIDLWTDVLRSGAYQGAMLDPTCAVDGCGPLDAQRFALGQIFTTLRRRFPNMLLIGCGGPSASFPGGEKASGYWLENWPEQNPVGWSPVTRLCFDAPYRYAQPHLQVIAMARSAPDPQAMRFGLGTSCLFDGVFAYGPPDWKGSAHLDWIAPEALPLGWLGQPIGAPWATAGGLWTREFEGGSVTVNTVAKDATFTRKP